MDTSITAEITEVVRKNLPAHVSDTLQKELAELAELRSNNAKLKHLAIELEKQIAGLKGALEQHGLLASRERQVAVRETEISVREAKMELNEYKVEAADAARAEMRDIVRDVFANSRFKYTETSSRDVLVPSGAGGVYMQRAGSDKAGSIEQ